MLFTIPELIMNGVSRNDYAEIIEEMTKGVTPAPLVDPFVSLVEYYQNRAMRMIKKRITDLEYQKIVDKTTGDSDLEDDLKDAELMFTQSYMIEARKKLNDDGFQAQSEEGISVTKEIGNTTTGELQRKALILIRRHYQC